MKFDALTQREHMLQFRAQRNEVLASNIANADTPGYKARDITFSSALRAFGGDDLKLAGSSDMHLDTQSGPNPMSTRDALKYRIPMQPALDGNTVETDVEQAAFAENALMYRASLAFIDSQIRTIKFAIKGGD
ncbi:MAG TPA: flagellar basal body rod protein FlgB [Woeseiaceae bacterium]|nr:flagellar basal body rod protein FlgB [Woeseiaceae bacterium]